MRKRATPSESLDQKIEKAQAKVIRTKAAYDKAVDELQILLDKRDARRKDEIWAAIIDSNKSYEQQTGDGSHLAIYIVLGKLRTVSD